jgi:hypothetical protein
VFAVGTNSKEVESLVSHSYAVACAMSTNAATTASTVAVGARPFTPSNFGRLVRIRNQHARASMDTVRRCNYGEHIGADFLLVCPCTRALQVADGRVVGVRFSAERRWVLVVARPHIACATSIPRIGVAHTRPIPSHHELVLAYRCEGTAIRGHSRGGGNSGTRRSRIRMVRTCSSVLCSLDDASLSACMCRSRFMCRRCVIRICLCRSTFDGSAARRKNERHPVRHVTTTRSMDTGMEWNGVERLTQYICAMVCVVAGEKGIYDFQDLHGSPPDPAPPMIIPCTMYIKKDKFLPKKSKLYLRYKQKSGGDELVRIGLRRTAWMHPHPSGVFSWPLPRACSVCVRVWVWPSSTFPIISMPRILAYP